MSRTDKEMPWWVICDWYEPAHGINCRYRIPRHWRSRERDAECTLPDRPVRHRGRFVYFRGLSTCTWETVWPSWRQARYLHVRAVPRWYVQHVWDNAERVRERDGLRKMVKEYNSNADLADGDFPNWQHRHCATWYWD